VNPKTQISLPAMQQRQSSGSWKRPAMSTNQTLLHPESISQKE
jgi:hypothetical protein